MVATTRDQHETIFHHCMSLIENPEYQDGSGTICKMLIENDINTIIDIISLDDEEIKAIYSSTTKIKPKQHLTMSQINGIKYLKYYNINQYKNNGSFLPKKFLKITREEFELFRISCNLFDYKEIQSKTPLYTHYQHVIPLKISCVALKEMLVFFLNSRMKNNGMTGTTEAIHKLNHNLWMRSLILSTNPDLLMK